MEELCRKNHDPLIFSSAYLSGLSWSGDDNVSAIGIPSDFERHEVNPVDPAPGPTITSILDFRKLIGPEDWKKGFIIEEGTMKHFIYYNWQKATQLIEPK